MDSQGFASLLTPDGWALLSELPPYDEHQALSLGEALRAQGVDPALAAAALTQSRLRAKATGKFGDFAQTMLLTEAGLQQATRLTVAARHAQRFRDAGVTRIADLGCGIGADSMAFASLGIAVLAVEADEVTAAAAAVNLSPFPNAVVRHGDAMAIDLGAELVTGVFADPARRTSSGKRLFDPKAYSPPLDQVLELRRRVPELGVKVAPGIPHDAVPEDAEAQWVSVDGDVVEAGLWFGKTRHSHEGGRAISRTALVLGPGGSSTRTDLDLPDDAPDVAAPGAFLYEPDGAIIRSGLVAVLAEEASGWLLDQTIAYVTSDVELPTPLATGYRVLDVFDFSLKRLKNYLRERGVGRLTIKKRGTAVVPEQLRKQLQLSGANEATIVLTRLAGKQSVLVVEPL